MKSAKIQPIFNRHEYCYKHHCYNSGRVSWDALAEVLAECIRWRGVLPAVGAVGLGWIVGGVRRRG